MRWNKLVLMFGAILLMLFIAADQAQQQQARGQAPTAPGEPPPKVLVAGENPAITLRDKEGGTALTSVNFWRVHWSPVGAGSVCFVTVNEPDNLRIAIHDNPKVLQYVSNELMSSLNANFNNPPFTPILGTIVQSGDVVTSRKETCKSDRYNIEVTWSGLGEARWVDIKPGGNTLMTFVMVGATGAEVLINGKKAPGGVFPGPGFPPSFLALNETWRR